MNNEVVPENKLLLSKESKENKREEELKKKEEERLRLEEEARIEEERLRLEEEEEQAYMMKLNSMNIENSLIDMLYVNSFKEKEKNNNKIKKSSNKLSLDSFNTKIDEIIVSSKPKKFISKRVEEKKPKEVQAERTVKRLFQPRLLPYNFVFSNKRMKHMTIDVKDECEFPSL